MVFAQALSGDIHIPAWMPLLVSAVVALLFAITKGAVAVKNGVYPELRYVVAGFLTCVGLICLGTVTITFIGQVFEFIELSEKGERLLPIGLAGGMASLLIGTLYRYMQAPTIDKTSHQPPPTPLQETK